MDPNKQETRERAVTNYLLGMRFSEQESARNAYTWLITSYIPTIEDSLINCKDPHGQNMVLIPSSTATASAVTWEDLPSLVTRIHLAKALILFGMTLENSTGQPLTAEDIKSLVEVDASKSDASGFSVAQFKEESKNSIDVVFPANRDERNRVAEFMVSIGRYLRSLEAQVDHLERILVLDIGTSNAKAPMYQAITWLTTTFFDAALKYVNSTEGLMRRYAILPPSAIALVEGDSSVTPEQRSDMRIWNGVAGILGKLGYKNIATREARESRADGLGPLVGLMPPDDVFTSRTCLAIIRFLKDERVHRDAVAKVKGAGISTNYGNASHLFEGMMTSDPFGSCEEVAERAAVRTLRDAERHFEEVRDLSDAMNLLVNIIESSNRMEVVEEMRNVAIMGELEKSKDRLKEMTGKVNELDAARREFEKLLKEATKDIERLSKAAVQLQKELDTERNKPPVIVAGPTVYVTGPPGPPGSGPPPPPGGALPPMGGPPGPPPPLPPGGVLPPRKKLPTASGEIPTGGTTKKTTTAKKLPSPAEAAMGDVISQIAAASKRKLKKVDDATRQADKAKRDLDHATQDATGLINRAESLAGERGQARGGFKKANLQKPIDPVIQKAIDEAGEKAETAARQKGLSDESQLKSLGNKSRREVATRLLTEAYEKKRNELIAKQNLDLLNKRDVSTAKLEKDNALVKSIYKEKLVELLPKVKDADLLTDDELTKLLPEDETPPPRPNLVDVGARVAAIVKKEESEQKETLKRNELIFKRDLETLLKQYPVAPTTKSSTGSSPMPSNEAPVTENVIKDEEVVKRMSALFHYVNRLYLELSFPL